MVHYRIISSARYPTPPNGILVHNTQHQSPACLCKAAGGLRLLGSLISSGTHCAFRYIKNMSFRWQAKAACCAASNGKCLNPQVVDMKARTSRLAIKLNPRTSRIVACLNVRTLILCPNPRRRVEEGVLRLSHMPLHARATQIPSSYA